MDGKAPAGGPLPGGGTPAPSGPASASAPDAEATGDPGAAAASGPAAPPGRNPYPEAGPALVPGDDFDLDEDFARLVRGIDAGRVQPPPEPALEGPAVSVSLGGACGVDPELLAAMCGPDGLGGQALSAAFGQGKAADALRPGPLLAALTAQLVPAPGPRTTSAGARLDTAAGPAVPGLGSLSDDELVGVLQAARRLANLADYQQTVAIAEFARRRQAGFEAALAAGRPAGCREGEFPGEELAMELAETAAWTGLRIDTAVELATRLPRTLAGMADGSIDLGRAMTIASRTLVLAGADAAYADEVLAAAAPGRRPDQLARKAAALEEKLAPEAVRARKERARREDQRVEVRREGSGNASLAGRELATADVMAAKAHIDAIAVQLRNSGLVEGTMGHLRALAMTDLTQGRDPLDRIKPQPAPGPAQPQPPAGPVGTASDTAVPAGTVSPVGADGPAPGAGFQPRGNDEAGGRSRRGLVRPGEPAPLPALVNLLVPAATAFGWGTAPAQAAGWGLLDAEETRALLQAAARHPRTRWCMTVPTAPPWPTAARQAGTPGRRATRRRQQGRPGLLVPVPDRDRSPGPHPAAPESPAVRHPAAAPALRSTRLTAARPRRRRPPGCWTSSAA